MLGRKNYANILTKLITNYKDGFVLAINNKWGTGKTTFIKMWQQQLIDKKFQTVYFNAWENDFDTDPLTALMGELNTLVKKKDSEKMFKNVLEKAAIFSKNIVPGVVKAVAKKYVDDEAIAVIEGTAKSATAILEEEIEAYAKKKKGINEFKEELTKFVAKAATDDKPIVFIIDELDRCRPNYAVEALEKIKHFFSVPGIIFVLSIDKIQLKHAIKGVYGNENIDAEDYLRRFIDIEYSLPAPDTEKFCGYMFSFFDFEAFFDSEERQKHRPFITDRDSLIQIASILFKENELTLRQQEKIFAHTRLGLSFFKSNEYVFPNVYIILVFFKTSRNDFYDKIRAKTLSVPELMHGFSELMPEYLHEEKKRTFIYTEALLAYLYNNSLEKRENLFDISRSDIRSQFDNNSPQTIFFSMLQSIKKDPHISDSSIEFLLRRIDLIDEMQL